VLELFYGESWGTLRRGEEGSGIGRAHFGATLAEDGSGKEGELGG